MQLARPMQLTPQLTAPMEQAIRLMGRPEHSSGPWLSFTMGRVAYETQTKRVYHGTSLRSALQIYKEGFIVFDTSMHGGKSGFFCQESALGAWVYAKTNQNDGEDLDARHTTVILEAMADPDRDYFDEVKAGYRGKCLRHYNTEASYKDTLWVWQAPVGSIIQGFGDGMGIGYDPIGFSFTWLHVHCDVLIQYQKLGSPEIGRAISRGSLYVCRGHYKNAEATASTRDIVREWSCGKTCEDPRACGWTKSAAKYTCPQRLPLF